MSRRTRFLRRILSGTADANVAFDDLTALLRALGFAERRRGSHIILSRAGVAEIINLQRLSSGLAKPYQVRQVRQLLVTYDLVEDQKDG